MTINTRRSELYRWFATLFLSELNSESFHLYASGGAEGILEIFTAIGLKTEGDLLRSDISDFVHFDHLDLAADFTELFLMDGETSALPYASYYLETSHLLYGKSEKNMRQQLNDANLHIHPHIKEPADHLAIILSVMAVWCEKTSATRQAAFLEKTLLNWVPQFSKRCSTHSVNNRFYPHLAQLLTSFLITDHLFLSGK